ncbi:glutaminase [Phaeobacter sp. HF9A]|uniref:glutaminase n=1 Tax=Phaeobacter sp. HF9A TaxID=2721561 RepID=UPI001430DBFB|nr:glutaminase [Phaeobacter sp. HF9A]NIZ15736.1 glutaminase [Phaeobacter sp. HF9A]
MSIANPELDFRVILDQICAEMQAAPHRGEAAQYIPELASIDTNQFGMAVALADGRVFVGGDADRRFSIQSVSKVFTLALALGRLGEDLWRRVGREPSGLPFNSIMQLEHEEGIPRNPFINPGALVVTDAILAGHAPREVLGELLRFVRAAAEDDDIHIDEAVARSETEHGDRNMALAHFMAAHGNFRNSPALTCGTYFHQCAIEMTPRQLAMSGRFLVGGPNMPGLIARDQVRRINALMLTCGHYDGSGDFAYRVGLPGKSGVGGGILVIAPGRASIAVWSPGLNQYGNSHLGTLAVERFAQATGWSVFG